MKDKNLRIKEVAELVGLSESAVYAKLQKSHPSYDETFPKQFPIGGRAMAWSESEVRVWIAAQAARRQPSRAADPAGEQQPQAPYAKAQFEAVKTLLTTKIREGLTVSHREAMLAAELWPDRDPDREAMEVLLECLSRESFKEHGVLLGFLVQDRQQPGPRTLTLAKELLGLERPNVRFHVEKIYEALEDPTKKARGGALLWTKNVELGTVRLIRDPRTPTRAAMQRARAQRLAREGAVEPGNKPGNNQ